jgi:hypothetical protein
LVTIDVRGGGKCTVKIKFIGFLEIRKSGRDRVYEEMVAQI